MKRCLPHLADFLVYLSIYPLLIFIIVMTTLSCGIGTHMASRLTSLFDEPEPTHTWRLVVLPTVTPTPTSGLPEVDSDEVEEYTPLPTASPTSPMVSHLVPDIARVRQHLVPIQASLQKRAISPRFSTPTPTAGSKIANGIEDSSILFASLSMLTSTPILTTSSMVAPIPTHTPTPTHTPPPGVVSTSTTTLTSTETFSPSPTATASPISSPTSSPTPTMTPVPDYDFMLAEFYNSPTTNSFLLIYVAIVDPKEIPIGDMKIVGTRLDNNLTYESPLSKWHYEGYNAPSKHIKSGNVKFEPPGGIESTSWVLHLEDAHGNRQSIDIPFDVDENNKQWYFIKLRRKY